MKRVLLVSNTVMHYRVPVYNYFAARFEDWGYEFMVRSNKLQPENPHSIHFDFAELPFRFRLYRREIERLEPDFIILFLHLKDLIIWPLLHWLKRRGIPVIFWTKGVNLDDPENPIRYALFNHLHTVSDGLLLYSEWESRYVRPSNRSKVGVAPNTINFEEFPRVEKSREQIKREYAIPFEKVVLFVGRMGVGRGRKRVDHLIEVFRTLRRPGWGAVLVGSGMTDELRARIDPETTLYLGELYDPEHRQISELFKMADLFSIPGHVGLGLNQAFYWGLPVVTEEGGQPPEIHYLKSGRNGFIVPENDIAALGERISFLLEHDDVRKDFGENARNDIREKAHIERMFAGFLEAVQRLEPATAGRRRLA